MSAHSPGRQTSGASSEAMLTDAEVGLLLRLVAAEINDQETTNCERYISDAAAAAFARQMSRLRTVQRKLRRHRQARRASRTAEPVHLDRHELVAQPAEAGPAPEPGGPARAEDAVGFLALGATERVWALLRSETAHQTVTALARRAQVSRTTVANMIRLLERGGRLEVAALPGRPAYLLKPEEK
jgi:HTH domain